MPMISKLKFKTLKFKSPFKKLNFSKVVLPIILLIILTISILATYQTIFEDKFFPITFIGDSNVTFLNKTQAYQVLKTKTEQRLTSNINFNYNNQTYSINLATASANLAYSFAIDNAFMLGHSETWPNRLFAQVKNLFSPQIVSVDHKLIIDSQLNLINRKVLTEPVNAKLVIDESNPATTSAAISITEGKSGQELDSDLIKKQTSDYLNYGHYDPNLPIKSKEPQVTTAKALTAKQFIESNSKEPLTLNFDQNKWVIDTKVLLTFINLEKDNILDSDTMASFLKEMVSSKIDQPVQEGQFNFDENTKRVTAFKASQEGRKLDLEKSIALINYSLKNSGPKNITLPVEVVKPKILTENVNNMGINELIGEGISNFAGSIENRIYNVGHGASKINGVLIPPGETFSFNKTVGDITAATGFRQAYVIKSGRTVLDDGGGICQVSTTLFRAVLDAGLPIVERTAHAYRVSYYEQGFAPGLDATIFYPSVDFKFKNDTPNYILIQTQIAKTTLYVNLYGTADGRITEITKPIIHSQTPPLPELRQDDPELPIGTVKQVDWPAWGANVSFKRTVTKNGQSLISETIRSNYRPWQAVYLVGIKNL
jgi:vancomycin resistance protein YoaR